MQPIVSILMTAYNAERFIDQSINSILNQTVSSFELIIINDGSTDNTSAIIHRYKNTDNRIKIINNPNNLFVPRSLNRGLEAAKGQFIAILDADDIALPHRIEIETHYLNQHPEVFLVAGKAQLVNQRGAIVCLHPAYKNLEKILPQRNVIVHSTIMFRNDKHHFYRPNMYYCLDYDLYLNLLSEGKQLHCLNQVVTKYRVLENSTSNSHSFHQHLFIQKCQLFYHQRINTGKDEYNIFNPSQILNQKVDKHYLLEQEIRLKFRTHNMKEARKLMRDYSKQHGYKNIYLLFYLSSFLPVRLLYALRRLKLNSHILRLNGKSKNYF